MHRHTPLALGATLLTLAVPTSALADWTTPEPVSVPQGAFGTLSGYGDGAAIGHGFTNLVGAVRRTGTVIASPFTATIGDSFEHSVDVQQAGNGDLTALARRQRPRLPFRVRATLVPASGSAKIGPLTISPSKRSAVNPVLSVARDGSAIAAWGYRDTATSGWYVQAAVRKTGETRFGPAQPLSTAPTADLVGRPTISVAAGNGGRFAVTWSYPSRSYSPNERPDQPLTVRTTEPDGSFAAPQTFAGGGSWPAVSLAFSPSGGELTLGITRSGNDSTHQTAAMYVTVGTPGGPLPTPTPFGRGGEGFAAAPTLAYGADGSEVLGWIAPTNLNGPGGRIMVATRPAGGAFGALQPLAPEPVNPEILRIASGPGGKAVIAWEAHLGQMPDTVGTYPLYALFAVVRADSGSPFGTPVKLSADTESVTSPDVTVTDNGDVVAAFKTWDNTRYEMTSLTRG